MEAQRDQHEHARPAITDPPQSIDEYDVILLGYPNWWVSIPMPIATFLESYDFSGKTILPFCSHGGGRFGQSLTAIAKLAPQAVIALGSPFTIPADQACQEMCGTGWSHRVFKQFSRQKGVLSWQRNKLQEEIIWASWLPNLRS